MTRRALTTLTIATALLFGAVGPAAAEGIDVRSTVRYTVAADEAPVSVRMSITVENTTPDQYVEGGVRYFYYEDLVVPLPHAATSVRATAGGQTLTVTRTTADASTDRARIVFASPLRRAQQLAIDLTFAIPGSALRSADVTRVGDGYASFAVTSPGDPGQATITVVAPEAMTFGSTSDDWVTTTAGGQQTVTLTSGSGDEGGLYAAVSLIDTSKSPRKPVVLSDNTFRLQPWPNDPDWAAFVEKNLRTGAPAGGADRHTLAGRPRRHPRGRLGQPLRLRRLLRQQRPGGRRR